MRLYTRRNSCMFLLVVLSTVLGVGVIVFILTRESFRASRVRPETPPVAPSMKKSSDVADINDLMRRKLPAPLPQSRPAVLFSERSAAEADAFADILAQAPEKPILLNESKAYLRLEEDDDSLERLLMRRLPGKGAHQAPPREFSIGVTEKNEPSPEREKTI